MNNLENFSFNELSEFYSKHFTLGYLGYDMSDKLACIALTCYITNEIRKKGKKITCYDVLLKVGKHASLDENCTFLKALGAVCEDFMYGCKTFPTLGAEPKEMPKQLKILLDKYLPF